MKKLFPEFFGAFSLVFGGCGSAILVAGFPELGIGYTTVSLVLGLIVIAMTYAVGYISGRHILDGHYNPAVSIGLWIGGKLNAKDLPGYIVAQVIGVITAAILLYFIVSITTGFETIDSFTFNGFGDSSLEGYGMISVIVAEVVLTALFLLMILKKTNAKASQGFGLIATGLGLILIYFISIPISNALIDTSRSLSQTLYAYIIYLSQVWVFWLAPILGAIIGGLVYENFVKKYIVVR